MGNSPVTAATRTQQIGFIRLMIWHNSGFGSLRKIRRHLDGYEPRHDPTVIPVSQQLLSMLELVVTPIRALQYPKIHLKTDTTL